MDLGPEDRYAAAALFTLALHLTQVEGGQNGEPEAAWGATDDPPKVDSREEKPDLELDNAKWAAFWGWDCCAPGGLLERVYAALGIPSKSWAALKHLPEIGGLSRKQRSSYMRVVASYMGVLDATLPTVHVSGRHSSPPQPRWSLLPSPEVATQDHSDRQAEDPMVATQDQSNRQTGDLLGASSAHDLHLSEDHQTSLGKLLAADAVALCAQDGMACTDGAEVASTIPPVTHAKQFEALLSDSDSDLEEDLAAVHLAEHILEKKVSGDHMSGVTSATRQVAEPGPLPSDLGVDTLRSEGQENARHEASMPVALHGGSPAHLDLHVRTDADMDALAQSAARSAADGDVRAASPAGKNSVPLEGAGQEGVVCGGLNSSGFPEEGNSPLPVAQHVFLRGTEPVDPGDEVGLLEEERRRPLGVGGHIPGEDASKQGLVKVEEPGTAGDDAAVPGAGKTERTMASDEMQEPQRASDEMQEPQRAERGQVASEGGPGAQAEGILPCPEDGQAAGGGQAQVRRSASSRPPPSAKALGATWELLEGCLFRMPADASSFHDSEEEEFGEGDTDRMLPLAPKVRWYDARQRVALKRVAMWLNVPWAKVAGFEQLLAYRLLLPQDAGGARPPASAWDVGMKAAKIGATTVGIGALFALTGGLAAPAIAAGMGTAIGMAGGSAAMAGGVSSFLATTAGTAVLASGVGAAGGTFAGSRMARRIGDVKEFGFWEVCPATAPAPEGDAMPDLTKGTKKGHPKHKRCQSTLPVAASNTSHRRTLSHDPHLHISTQPIHPSGGSPQRPSSGSAQIKTHPGSASAASRALDPDFASPTSPDPFLSYFDAEAEAMVEEETLVELKPLLSHGNSDFNAKGTEEPGRKPRDILLPEVGGDDEMEELLFGTASPPSMVQASEATSAREGTQGAGASSHDLATPSGCIAHALPRLETSADRGALREDGLRVGKRPEATLEKPDAKTEAKPRAGSWFAGLMKQSRSQALLECREDASGPMHDAGHLTSPRPADPGVPDVVAGLDVGCTARQTSEGLHQRSQAGPCPASGDPAASTWLDGDGNAETATHVSPAGHIPLQPLDIPSRGRPPTPRTHPGPVTEPPTGATSDVGPMVPREDIYAQQGVQGGPVPSPWSSPSSPRDAHSMSLPGLGSDSELEDLMFGPLPAKNGRQAAEGHADGVSGFSHALLPPQAGEEEDTAGGGRETWGKRETEKGGISKGGPLLTSSESAEKGGISKGGPHLMSSDTELEEDLFGPQTHWREALPPAHGAASAPARRAPALAGLGSDSELEDDLFGPRTGGRGPHASGYGSASAPTRRPPALAGLGSDSELEDDLFGPTSPPAFAGRGVPHHGAARGGVRSLPNLPAGQAVVSGEEGARPVRGSIKKSPNIEGLAGPRAHMGAAQLPRVASTGNDDPLSYSAAVLEGMEREVEAEGRGQDSEKNTGDEKADKGSAEATSCKAGGANQQSRWSWRPRKAKEPPLLLAPVSLQKRPEDMRLSITIGVNGWIKDREDYLTMWRGLDGIVKDSELFTLVWESQELKALNKAVINFMTQQAGQEVVKYALTHFFYTGLVAAVAAPVALVSFAQMIDTAWAVVLDRAQKAGQLLAHVLLAGGHGDRPVVLIGYSMGARLVFHCLLELCRHNAKGLVEAAVVVGVPVSTRQERWAMARRAVAGRFVNGYSQRDWMLGLVYRLSSGLIKGAGGLCPVDCPGVENVNLTSIITGHFDYINKMPEILELIGLYQ